MRAVASGKLKRDPESPSKIKESAAMAADSISEFDADALLHGNHRDPFAVLGPHRVENHWVVRCFQPGARRVDLEMADGSLLPMQQSLRPGLFCATLPAKPTYRLRVEWPGGTHLADDPYSFGLLLGEYDLYLFREGTHRDLNRCLGAQPLRIEGIDGVRFAVWAPNARRVSVVGDFNTWDGRRHPMRLRPEAGVWELFIPGVGRGEKYKFEVLDAEGGITLKADPYALAMEGTGQSAAVVTGVTQRSWGDGAWMASRPALQSTAAALSIYEVHAASWRRHIYHGNRSYNWRDLQDSLIPYVQRMGFTHIELLPVMAHPFGGSWGYQPVGIFAPDPSMGSGEDFAAFVDACHQAGIGVILDWVPAHFPDDEHGLVRFDGSALYEHEDPREGFHHDWNTLIYNYGRAEVKAFLIASALHWLETYHIDGLRVDAVASMLYRDYSRPADQWVPNRYGGRENLEAIDFLRALNAAVHERCPGALTIAEESTAWPGVTRGLDHDGLGFSYKWNMGWMHDTLRYMKREPVHRAHHHSDLTFGLVYAFSERFVLPLSHDEVVHGKGTLIGRMPGDHWQRYAGLRAYFAFMWAHPGKKLLFMGGEFAQEQEWNHDGELSWNQLGIPECAGVQSLVSDLNAAYRGQPALYGQDASQQGFEWVIGDDHRNSVYAFIRHAPQTEPVLCVANLTPVPRDSYRIGVPRAGRWQVLIDSDSGKYAGSGYLHQTATFEAEPVESHGKPHSLRLSLPPLATLMLVPA